MKHLRRTWRGGLTKQRGCSIARPSSHAVENTMKKTWSRAVDCCRSCRRPQSAIRFVVQVATIPSNTRGRASSWRRVFNVTPRSKITLMLRTFPHLQIISLRRDVIGPDTAPVAYAAHYWPSRPRLGAHPLSPRTEALKGPRMSP
jgi:hypothetical protein